VPDLDLLAAQTYWKNYNDPMIFRVISFMETVETETLDGNPALEKAIKAFGDGLDKLKKFELSREEQFIKLCVHLKTSRILRILQSIDTIEPGSASKVLMYAEENNTPGNRLTGLFLRRNIIFERLRLLARVFARERFELILKAMEQTL
jgi:intracellular multiplication protein IcmW